MNGFRYKFYRFMEGRYGLRALQDPMQILIYAVYLLLVLIQFFTNARAAARRCVCRAKKANTRCFARAVAINSV